MVSRTLQPELEAMLASAHSSWQPVLERGLQAVAAADPVYLPALSSSAYLPTQGRLFAAFSLPLEEVRHVLVGEGPYPRADSATGVCFMDGAVEELWSTAGLSKKVNRATSLRNFMKMLLVADGRLAADRTAGDALADLSTAARKDGSGTIQTLADLQDNLLRQGFLLLNAALVFRPEIPPVREARAWQPFLEVVLEALAAREHTSSGKPPVLVLWGKIAGQVMALPVAGNFRKAIAEHPYNLSFIANTAMHDLFGPMKLLQLRSPPAS